MDYIRLTQEHKDKLVEMVKVLFPETPHLHWGKNWDSNEIDIGNYANGERWDLENKPQLLYHFHWFEFCLTHLLNKLQPDNSKQTSGSFDITDKEIILCDAILYGSHPIDYFYTQFKRLEQQSYQELAEKNNWRR